MSYDAYDPELSVVADIAYLNFLRVVVRDPRALSASRPTGVTGLYEDVMRWYEVEYRMERHRTPLAVVAWSAANPPAPR